jgi:hypothetical protein
VAWFPGKGEGTEGSPNVFARLHLGPEEGQSNCNDVDKWRRQRPVHRGADQAGMNLRINVAPFGGDTTAAGREMISCKGE